jgi:hypothetical protein
VPITTATDPGGMTGAAGRELVRFETLPVVLVLVEEALPHPLAPNASRAITTIPTARLPHPITVDPG